jgi:hypothetical protein
MIPGRLLHRLAAHICSERSLGRIVEPAIADLQKEYAAPAAGGAARHLWVLLTGYVAILKVIAMCAVSVPSTGDERRAVARTLAWSVTMVLVIAVLLMVPPLHSRPSMGWKAATTLVPQAMVLAIPIGIAFGLAFGLAATPTMNLAKAALLGAVAASALSLGILVWAMPAGNQAFREMTFRELRAGGYEDPVIGPQKGYNEMALSELRGEIARFTAEGETRLARLYAFRLHLRMALAAATLALVSLLVAARVSHPGLRGLLAFGACFVYWALIFTGEWGTRRGYLTPPIGAWLPNLVLSASAIVIASSRSSRLRGSLNSAQ